ncbi:MAG TPA: hypothetical protein VK390_00570 [Propionibacteriaceae bacterium]|nr:hypothetical protein [Propionibacteriaceae bacterium]
MPLSTVSVILLEPVPLFEFGVAVESKVAHPAADSGRSQPVGRDRSRCCAVATHVGFPSGVVMREHFRREIGLAPAEYRRRFLPPRVIG